jgi:hypothetical protein
MNGGKRKEVFNIHVTRKTCLNRSTDFHYLIRSRLPLTSSMASSSKQILQSSPSKKEGDKSWIPDGYVTAAGPDGNQYLVPDFMVQSLHQTLEAHRMKVDLGVDNAAGSVSVFLSFMFSSKHYQVVPVPVPADY